MRLIFAGTPEPAVPALRALAAAHERGEHQLVGVVTRPDAPLGRKRVLTPSPVAQAATELLPDVPLIRTARLDDEATATIAALEPELGVIVAYGGLVRERLLSTPRHGWINLHFSLLPRWRGAAPVQHAIIAGDRETGTSVFQLVPALDAGDVFAMAPTPIDPDATAGDLLERLAVSGAAQLVSVVDAIAAGAARAVPQDGETSYAGKLDVSDGVIRWNEPSSLVLGRIHGTTPEPGAHTLIDGARLKVLTARRTGRSAPLAPGELALVDGAVLAGTATAPIELVTVQPAGRGAMDASAWWRGLRVERLVADTSPIADALPIADTAAETGAGA